MGQRQRSIAAAKQTAAVLPDGIRCAAAMQLLCMAAVTHVVLWAVLAQLQTAVLRFAVVP